jgi:hypothetical protein
MQKIAELTLQPNNGRSSEDAIAGVDSMARASRDRIIRIVVTPCMATLHRDEGENGRRAGESIDRASTMRTATSTSVTPVWSAHPCACVVRPPVSMSSVWRADPRELCRSARRKVGTACAVNTRTHRSGERKEEHR